VIINALRGFLANHFPEQHPTLWVALSGGVDSCVLLHALTQLRESYALDLHAIHINHHVQTNAQEMTAHCRKLCDQWAISLQIKDAPIQPDAVKTGFEAHARQLRTALWQNTLPADANLCFAHHQNDQVETVLLQLLRGAGIKGLSAMPVHRQHMHPSSGLTEGSSPGNSTWVPGQARENTLHYYRPLLDVTRADILAYAKQQSVSWVEDPSNQNQHYARNRIRHTLLPELTKHWPQAVKTLARSARLCAEADGLLHEWGEELLGHCVEELDSGLQPSNYRETSNTLLSIKRCGQLSPEKQRLVLRHWITKQGYPLPSAKKLREIQGMFVAGEDRLPCVDWAQVEIRRYQYHLYLMPALPPHDATQVIPWHDTRQALPLPSLGQHCHLLPSQRLGITFPEDALLSIRFRQGGERIQLPGHRHHHPLKKYFQEQGVPPWLRDRIPLLYINDHLAAIVGFTVLAPFVVERGGWVVDAFSSSSSDSFTTL